MDGKKTPYFLNNISYYYLKDGRYVGDEEYEMEIKFVMENNSYKKYYVIYYDEEEEKNLQNKVCWHCSIPFSYVNNCGCYMRNRFYELENQGDDENSYVCKNCFFMLSLYEYKRVHFFKCGMCGSQRDICFANVKPSICWKTSFNCKSDLLCLNCSKNELFFLLVEGSDKKME